MKLNHDQIALIKVNSFQLSTTDVLLCRNGLIIQLSISTGLFNCPEQDVQMLTHSCLAPHSTLFHSE
jgi:hypothetical protein